RCVTTSIWLSASIAVSARKPARLMLSLRARTSNSLLKRVKNCISPKRSCSPTAIAGSVKSLPICPPMHRIAEREEYDASTILLLPVRRHRIGVGVHGHFGQEPGACRAVPDPDIL